MSEREIRSCTTEDGILIAYSVTGDGPPLLVCHEGLESFTLDHLVTGLEDFFDQLGRGRCLVRYDPRGIGLSQRDIDDFSLEAATLDLLAVVEATGFGRVSIFAPCQGTPDAMAFAARYPGRVDRLILYCAIASMQRPVQDGIGAFAQLWRTTPRVAAQTWVDTVDRERYPELGVQLATMLAQSVNSHDAPARLEQSALYDVTELLPQIQAPTLVIHRRADHGVPIASAQGVAIRIPATKLVVLAGGAHWFSKDPDSLIAAVRSFLPEEAATGSPAAQPAVSAFRTILFTDLVGHTEMMQRLGDDRGRDVLREHERITRQVLKQHGGVEVKTDGDSFMVSFASVIAALECAVGLQRVFAKHNETATEPILVRMGLNAGEPIQEEGDLFGSTVILASRIAAEADAGEILVADTVRGLCSGKGFLFADRGEFVAKGFEEPVRVYEVSWRE